MFCSVYFTVDKYWKATDYKEDDQGNKGNDEHYGRQHWILMVGCRTKTFNIGDAEFYDRYNCKLVIVYIVDKINIGDDEFYARYN